MLAQIVIASALIFATTAIHAAGTLTAFSMVRWNRRRRWSPGVPLRKVCFVAGVVLLMFLGALLEIALWAAVYLQIGALADLDTAIYFSAVTFGSLGYGDVTLGRPWRLLSALECVNGIIMFGWSTAIVLAAVHMVVFEDEPVKGQREGQTAGRL